MCSYIFFGLVALPVAELYTLYRLSIAFGVEVPLALTGGTALLGTFVLLKHKIQSIRTVFLQSLLDPSGISGLWKLFCMMLAGVLLILPGVLTDLAGLALFFPAIQERLRLKAMKRMKGGMFSARMPAGFGPFPNGTPPPQPRPQGPEWQGAPKSRPGYTRQDGENGSQPA